MLTQRAPVLARFTRNDASRAAVAATVLIMVMTAILAVAAIENLVLGRRERVVTVPRGVLIDVSEPGFLARVIPPEA